MNKLLLTFALLGALAPTLARAQDGPIAIEDAVPIPGEANPQMARVSVFIAGLKEPQGLALDNNGDIIVCDYGAGEVLRFNAMGAKKAVLASGLKGPSQIIASAVGIIVTEREANRVVYIDSEKAVIPINLPVPDPIGIAYVDSQAGSAPLLFEGLTAVSRARATLYQIRGFNYFNWSPIHRVPSASEAARQGFSHLANDGDTLFVSNESNGKILMFSALGRRSVFATDLGVPTGLAVRNFVIEGKELNNSLYVCDQSEGGRLWKLDDEGVKTLVATGLGKPDSILFFDSGSSQQKIALVSDRNGRVLQLNWVN